MTPFAMELSACVRLPPLAVAPAPWTSERCGPGIRFATTDPLSTMCRHRPTCADGIGHRRIDSIDGRDWKWDIAITRGTGAPSPFCRGGCAGRPPVASRLKVGYDRRSCRYLC